MVLLELAMFPTDKGVSVSEYVSKLIKHIKESGITYQLTPMGTIIEGEWDDVFKLVDDCFKILQPHSDRIYSTIKIDYRKGQKDRMKSKINSIIDKIGDDISHS